MKNLWSSINTDSPYQVQKNNCSFHVTVTQHIFQILKIKGSNDSLGQTTSDVLTQVKVKPATQREQKKWEGVILICLNLLWFFLLYLGMMSVTFGPHLLWPVQAIQTARNKKFGELHFKEDNPTVVV